MRIPREYTEMYLYNLVSAINSGADLSSIVEEDYDIISEIYRVYGDLYRAIRTIDVDMANRLRNDNGILMKEYESFSKRKYINAGHRFEVLVGKVLNDLGLARKDRNAHVTLLPDFSNGSTWYDAKLSEHTYRGINGRLSTDVKYEPHCDKLVLIYALGKEYGIKKISNKTTLISIDFYLDELPESKSKYYREAIRILKDQVKT